MRNTGMLATSAVVMVLLTGCGTTVMESAVAECGLEGNEHARVGDEGTTLVVKTISQENVKERLLDSGAALDGVEMDDLACLQTELQVPEHVLSQMGSTRALDGTKEASWDGMEASWSYHPDSGMRLTIHQP